MVISRLKQAARLMQLANGYLTQLEDGQPVDSLRHLYQVRVRLLRSLGVRLRRQ